MPKPTTHKRVKTVNKCPHCDLEYDFPVEYCPVCDMHTHSIFLGDAGSQMGMCTDCWHGANKKARAYWRSIRRWAPFGYYEFSWDDPEWYDSTDEWMCATMTNLWVPNEYSITEM